MPNRKTGSSNDNRMGATGQSRSGSAKGTAKQTTASRGTSGKTGHNRNER